MYVCVYSTMYMFWTIQFLWCNFKRLVSIRLAGWSGTMQAIILSLQRQNNDATTIISNIFTFSGFCFVFFSLFAVEKNSIIAQRIGIVLEAIIEFFYGFIYEMKIILIFDACCELGLPLLLFSHNSLFGCCDTLSSCTKISHSNIHRNRFFLFRLIFLIFFLSSGSWITTLFQFKHFSI